MPAISWVTLDDTPPMLGPPKPVACTAGWASHRWTLTIEEGEISFDTAECRLCRDGVAELEREYLAGEFLVRIEMIVEHYGDDVNAYLNIEPISKEP